MMMSRLSFVVIFEIMSQLKLDHHGKPGSTERPFRPSMGLLSSAHPRSKSYRMHMRIWFGFSKHIHHVTSYLE
ncbi:unnamed protein product [Schistosoma haematobium]|nr:unnamed protein product [Schistosoma haematobium]